MDDLSILSCSCDKYSDVWGPMFGMFFKYWPDCPYKIYLMSNTKVYDDNRVHTIATGEDKTWSISFRKALNTIESKYVLVIMEDYLLQSKVISDEFETAIRYMENEKVDYLRLFPAPRPDRVYGQMGLYKIGKIDKDAEYRVSLQAAIWRRDYLVHLIDDRDSAWQFEYLGSKRSTADGSKFLSVWDKSPKLMLDYYCTGVIQRYWVKEAVELCEKNGIAVDLTQRPLEPYSVRWKRIVPDKYLGWAKRLIKATPIYNHYRARKYA